MVELLVALGAQVPVLSAQALMVEGTAHHHQQFVDLERLLQVIERAELHRLDRALDSGVRRHHQHLRTLAFGCGGDVLADQVDAAQLRHDVVHHHHVEGLHPEQPLRLARVRGLAHLVAGVAQRPAERLQNFLLVVHEEDRPPMRHQACSCPLSTALPLA
jgi:hypothetical protein